MNKINYKNHLLIKELPLLPDNWRIRPNRSIFQERVERGFNDKSLLSVTIDRGIIPQDDLLGSTSKKDSSNEDKSNYKLVKVNDIAYNKMRMWQGAVGYSDYEGIVSPAYVVLKPIADINSRYYHYLFRTNLYNTYAYTFSYGISNDTLSLRWDEFKRMFTLIPPRAQQDVIVKYLDEKITDIDKYISAKQKLIELLNEQKAAIINKAVTKGLDPNVKMKESEVPWLGEIPEKWAISKIKFVSRFNPPKNESLKNLDSNTKVIFLPMEKVSEQGKIENSLEVAVSNVSEGFTYFKKGDIIIAKITPCFENGKGAILYKLKSAFGFGSSEFIVLRPKNNIYASYLYYLTKSHFFRKVGAAFMTGTAGQKRISTEFVKNFFIPIPSIEEQKIICNYIEEKIKNINTAISSNISQILKIQEYKNTLITDTVTGKLKLNSNLVEIYKPKNPYFARTVLAAEIISQLYQEPTFGHTKFVKLLFLSEKLAELDIKTKYHRQAAGPYDNRALRSIDKQLEEHKWFKAVSVDGRIKYEPLENASEYRSWFDKYYSVEKGTIDFIVNTFKTAKTIQCEIVATLFSAWEDLLKENPNVSDNEIVNEVLNNWHESKKRIPKERWLKALKWMRSKDIKPV